MFFILSKVLDFMVQPLVWIGGLMLLAIIIKNQKYRKRFLIASFVSFLFFSNMFILTEFSRHWEIKARNIESITEPYDYGIVLGGMINYDKKLDRIRFTLGTDRIMQALLLYKKGKIKKIFISGGSGFILNDEIREGSIIRNFLINIGFDANDILYEDISKNTHENAVFTAKKILNKQQTQRFLIITSSMHMRRSLACFNKVGIKADPFAVDRIAGSRKFEIDHLLVPNHEALIAWEALIHEWIGCITYIIVGYI